jgi:hypothetical protein
VTNRNLVILGVALILVSLLGMAISMATGGGPGWDHGGHPFQHRLDQRSPLSQTVH